MNFAHTGLVVVLMLGLGLLGTGMPADALQIQTQGPTSFTISSFGTTASGNGADVSASQTQSASTSFNQFNSNVGVLMQVDVATTGTRTQELTGKGGTNNNGSLSVLSTTNANGTVTTPGTGGSETFNAKASDSCTGNNCTFKAQSYTPTASFSTDKTFTFAGSDAGAYVGASTFKVTRSLPVNLHFSSGFDKAPGSTVTYTNSWTGNTTVSYSYLLHAAPSFESASTVTSLLLDFGAVLQGGGLLSKGFDIFNRAGDRVDLNLTSFTPDAGNSSELTTNLATFTNLLAGGVNAFTAYFNTNNLGLFSSTYHLHFADNCPTGAASSTCLTLPDLDLTIIGSVIAAGAAPQPPVFVLIALGMVALAGRWMLHARRPV